MSNLILPQNIKKPKRVSLIGVGEVILEYAYQGLKKLEDEGIIEIVSIADIKNQNGTLENFDSRYKTREKERDSIRDIKPKLQSGKIKHYQTNGDCFDPETAKEFFEGTDIIYLATPNNVRTGLVKQIAEAGKSLVIEKPLANTVGNVNEITYLCRDIVAICGEHYAYKEPSIELFNNLDEKTKGFGKITSIEGVLEEVDFLEAERYEWLLDPAISGGGIWLDTGGHMTFLLHQLGARLRNVKEAKSYRYQFIGELEERNKIVKSETAAEVFMGLRGDNGNIDHNAYGHIKVAKCINHPQKYFKLALEHGEVYADFMNNSVSYFQRTNGKTELNEYTFSKESPYYNMMKSLVNFLDNNGQEPPTIIPGRIKASTDAIFRIYEYMKEGDFRRFH